MSDGDWSEAIVIDPRVLAGLKADVARLQRKVSWRARLLVVLLAAAAGALAHQAYLASQLATRNRQVATRARQVAECRQALEPSRVALEALAHSHQRMLAATEVAPSVGTRSWGRRFTVTKYIPRSPAYGRDNDGLTATMAKADPAARIVAVDPALIPYGSWVWVEGLGWYRAEDCGGAIKGFRLDLLTATTRDAMDFGKQERFVIVVPRDGLDEATS